MQITLMPPSTSSVNTPAASTSATSSSFGVAAAATSFFSSASQSDFHMTDAAGAAEDLFGSQVRINYYVCMYANDVGNDGTRARCLPPNLIKKTERARGGNVPAIRRTRVRECAKGAGGHGFLSLL